MPSSRKRIAVVTGTRAEYGLLKPVYSALSRTKGITPLLIVSGMHLAKEFGKTIFEIRADRIPIAAKVEMTPKSDSRQSMALAVSRGISGFVKAFSRLKPDVVLVLGDRGEALAAAIAASHMRIAVAHIHGGDVTKGGLDEYVRHAITKLSLIHFPATAQSARRVRKLGEPASHIFLVGAPGLDAIRLTPQLSRSQLGKKFPFLPTHAPFAVLVQHSVTTQSSQALSQYRESLEALSSLGLPVVAIYPNSDSGGRAMIRLLEGYIRKNPRFHAFASLPHSTYVSLLKHAFVLVGNSSSGIIEAPFFGTPVVNVGIRQAGRERAGIVFDVPPKRKEILSAMKKALKLKRSKHAGKNPYGDGHASKRIARILLRLNLSPPLFEKQLAFP